MWLDMVIHTYNASTQSLRQENCYEFNISMGTQSGTLCQKTKITKKKLSTLNCTISHPLGMYRNAIGSISACLCHSDRCERCLTLVEFLFVFGTAEAQAQGLEQIRQVFYH